MNCQQPRGQETPTLHTEIEIYEFKIFTSQADLDLGDVRTAAYVFAHKGIKAKSIVASHVTSETGDITVERDLFATNEVSAVEGRIVVGGNLRAKTALAKEIRLDNPDSTIDVESVFAQTVTIKKRVREGDRVVMKDVPVEFRQGGRIKQ